MRHRSQALDSSTITQLVCAASARASSWASRCGGDSSISLLRDGIAALQCSAKKDSGLLQATLPGAGLRTPLLSLHGRSAACPCAAAQAARPQQCTCASRRPVQRLHKQSPCRRQACVPICAGTLTEGPGKDVMRKHTQCAQLSRRICCLITQSRLLRKSIAVLRGNLTCRRRAGTANCFQCSCSPARIHGLSGWVTCPAMTAVLRGDGVVKAVHGI